MNRVTTFIMSSFQIVKVFIVYSLEMADESQNQSAEQASSDDDVLSTYEEMFKHRYTDSDADYVKTLQAPLAPPPCVENWYSRPKRSFDWTQRQDNRNRDYHNRDHHSRHGNEGYGNRDQRSYNDYGRNRDYNREHYQSKDYRHRDSGDHSDEQRNKYYRGSHGRGYRH